MTIDGHTSAARIHHLQQTVCVTEKCHMTAAVNLHSEVRDAAADSIRFVMVNCV